MDPPDRARRAILAELRGVLDRARELGFLGPGPADQHVIRALDLAGAVEKIPARALDLGSGGGVPGLPLALLWPESEWVLLDGSLKRSSFLEEAIDELGLSARVTVVAERAETAGRSPSLRATFDLAVARGFAGPAVTAECGSPFLRRGGRLVVAEPPGGEPGRWDPEGLDQLGMARGPTLDSPTAAQVLVQVELCPDRYPRRVGIPAKRPLW